MIGIESRGFVFAAPLALRLGIGFTMVRKRGKLPGSVVGHAYNLEYGDGTIEISSDLIPARSRVVIVDDLIATGGTAAAAIRLLRQLGADVVGFSVFIELVFLGGAAKLDGVPINALLRYD